MRTAYDAWREHDRYREGHKNCEICAKKQRDSDLVRRVKRRLDRQIEEERQRLIAL